MRKLVYFLTCSISLAGEASSRNYVDGTLILTQDVNDFEKYHQFGIRNGDAWSNQNNNSPTSNCLVHGPYEHMDFSGRVTGRVNISGHLRYGIYSPKTDPNYPWAFHFQDQEENQELFTLELVRSNSLAGTVVPLVAPKVIRLRDVQKIIDQDDNALHGFDYKFNGWMDVGTVDNVNLDPNEALEVRVCKLGTYAYISVVNTELGIFYYRP